MQFERILIGLLEKHQSGKTTPLLDSSGSLSVPELTPYSRHRRESKAIFSWFPSVTGIRSWFPDRKGIGARNWVWFLLLTGTEYWFPSRKGTLKWFPRILGIWHWFPGRKGIGPRKIFCTIPLIDGNRVLIPLQEGNPLGFPKDEGNQELNLQGFERL